MSGIRGDLCETDEMLEAAAKTKRGITSSSEQKRASNSIRRGNFTEEIIGDARKRLTKFLKTEFGFCFSTSNSNS
jgi:hypothetical protein